MKMNRFRAYLLIQGVVVLGVTIVFASIANRGIAALTASALFIITSVSILVSEFTRYRSQRSVLVTGATAVFLLLFILPIVALRLVYWGEDFSQITLGPISAKSLHQYSNYAFMLMLVAYFIESLKQNKKGPG